MHDGGTISCHGLLLDDTDQLEGAAQWSVRIWPFRALEMSHLQNIVILLQIGQKFTYGEHRYDYLGKGNVTMMKHQVKCDFTSF